MFQRKKWIVSAIGGMVLLGMVGCTPVPHHESTEVQSASDVKITATKSGAIEAGTSSSTEKANSAPAGSEEETPSTDDSKK